MTDADLDREAMEAYLRWQDARWDEDDDGIEAKGDGPLWADFCRHAVAFRYRKMRNDK